LRRHLWPSPLPSLDFGYPVLIDGWFSVVSLLDQIEVGCLVDGSYDVPSLLHLAHCHLDV
jgi:hypothetical protein